MSLAVCGSVPAVLPVQDQRRAEPVPRAEGLPKQYGPVTVMDDERVKGFEDTIKGTGSKFPGLPLLAPQSDARNARRAARLSPC